MYYEYAMHIEHAEIPNVPNENANKLYNDASPVAQIVGYIPVSCFIYIDTLSKITWFICEICKCDCID